MPEIPGRVDVACTLIHHPETERILIVGHRDGGWSLPGGAREPGETLAETARRETLEEAGILVTVERLVSVGERLPDLHALFFVFTARITDGFPRVTGDEEIVDVQWVDPQEANRLMPYWPMDLSALHRGTGAYCYSSTWDDRD
jgi:8-oxo-dGTP diphosphatase